MQHPTPEAEPRGIGSRLLLALVLIVGAGLGIVYCAYQDWLLGVIIAALVPGSAVAWLLEPVQALRAQGQETVDFRAELTRVFHREVTQLEVMLRGSCLGQDRVGLLLLSGC